MNKINKLEVCKQTRKFAADSLHKVLKKLLASNKPISEVTLRDAWLEELRKNKNIFPDGWYMPPPHGIGIVFGTEYDPDRINFPVLRKEEYWPRDDVFLDRKDGIIVVYSSPVNKHSLIIGDFGLTIYFGKNPNIQNHLKNTLRTNIEITDQIKIGMTLSDVNKAAYKIFPKNNVNNGGWISYNDPTGINIGHTIPFTGEEPTEHPNYQDWNSTLEYISKHRKFLNAIEKAEIKTGLAFTIEPRMDVPNHPEVPRAYFHTIVLVHHNGRKELLTGFDDLFTLARMSYMM